MQPAPPPIAIFSEIRQAEADLEGIIGIYKAGLGAPSNEKSGKAIIARQREGDIANFAYADNLKRAIEATGRILVDLIPHIYDGERDVKIRQLDDTETFLPINTTVGKAINTMQTNPQQYQGMDIDRLKQMAGASGMMSEFNNLKFGKYDVIVDTGPSYSTQRIESADNLIKLLQFVPKIGELGGDLIVKNMDILDSEELANRLRKTLPPGMVQPKEGEPPMPPMPPNPMMVAKVEETQAKTMKHKADAQKTLAEAQMTTAEARAQMRQIIHEVMVEVLSKIPGHPAQLEQLNQ